MNNLELLVVPNFFRVENEDHEGMYRGKNYLRSDDYEFSETLHPCPRFDELLKLNAPHLFDGWGWKGTEFIFGFDSLAQLRRWIYSNQILELLHSRGFFLSEMFGEVIVGNTQAVIFEPTAKRLNKKSLLTLLQ
jgi:hypothetical protein